ncbi:MAG: DUF5677 domain-containing protein [Thermomicrobiales bacterium]
MARLSPEQYAALNIPQLLTQGKSLVEVGHRIFETPRKFDLNDAPSLMAIAFSTKQLEHAGSVESLFQNDFHRDCEIIGRVSLEGYILLSWSFNSDSDTRKSRTNRWLGYEFVEEYRALKRRHMQSREPANADLKVDQCEWDHIRDLLLSKSEPMIRSKYKNTPPDKREIPFEDYWEYKWNNESIEIMIDDLGDKDAKNWYRTASQWIHWSPYPIFNAINLDEQEPIWFQPNAYDAAARGIAIVYYSLACCLLILDSHLELGQDKIIRSESPFNLPSFSDRFPQS